MSHGFPPTPTHKDKIDTVVKVLASVVDGRTAVYLSAPITSGKRFLEWCTHLNKDLSPFSSQYRDAHIREVIEPNRRHTRALVQKLRCTLPDVLFDPTAVMDLPDWTQGDYRHLWARIIEQYVKTAVFADEWHYSNGCAYEFLIAQQSGAMTLNQRQQPISIEEGLHLIHSAIIELQVNAQPTIFLEAVLRELSKILAINTSNRSIMKQFPYE
jgi:hypothetical protein